MVVKPFEGLVVLIREQRRDSDCRFGTEYGRTSDRLAEVVVISLIELLLNTCYALATAQIRAFVPVGSSPFFRQLDFLSQTRQTDIEVQPS